MGQTLTLIRWMGAALVLAGCGHDEGPSDPAKLSDREKQVIAVARQAVAQKEDWLDRAEFRIERHQSQWQVTAWRVEHPEAKGNLRYVPWGRRRIVIDDRDNVIEYGKGH